MPIDAQLAARLAELPLACVHREFPNKLGLVLHGPDDVRTPRALSPAFYGCFDWHSAVHGHWMLARLARVVPEGAFVPRARAALDRSLTAEHVRVEVETITTQPGFERPYGLAWLLCLAGELRRWRDADARRWATALEPLEQLAAERLRRWLPRLSHPIRSGEHSQTAFAMGLAHDWAAIVDDPLQHVIVERARAFYLADVDAPLAYEPSGHDFLSPCLAEADLMRRVLDPRAFGTWLRRFLPHIPEGPTAAWLPVAAASHPSDGKLAHLDGLSLSRAWMLRGIAGALPHSDPRRSALLAASTAHGAAGLAATTGEHYAGAHWLGTFATVLLTSTA